MELTNDEIHKNIKKLKERRQQKYKEESLLKFKEQTINKSEKIISKSVSTNNLQTILALGNQYIPVNSTITFWKHKS